MCYICLGILCLFYFNDMLQNKLKSYFLECDAKAPRL